MAASAGGAALGRGGDGVWVRGHDGKVTRAVRTVNAYPAWKFKLLSLATYFAEATKAKEATTGRPVRPNGSFRGRPQKANSLQTDRQ